MSRAVRLAALILLCTAIAAAVYLFASGRHLHRVHPPPSPPEEVPSGGQLVLAHPGMVGDVFPQQITDPATRLASTLIHEPLAARGPCGTLQPVLASTWYKEDDGRSWVVHLRAGVAWHNGDPFTAQDVVDNFHSAVADDSIPSPLTPLFDNVRSITQLNEHSVRINLDERRGTLPQMATVPLVHPEKLQGYPRATYNYQATGTGPFRLKRWSPHTETVLAANDDYWGAPPHLDGIRLVPFDDSELRIRSVQTGYAHCTWVNVAQDASPGLKEESIPTWDVVYLALPSRGAFLSDETARRAVDKILRLTAAQDGFVSGQMATGPWPPEVPLQVEAPDDQPGIDKEQLTRMLNEAGWSRSEGQRYRSKGDHRASFRLLVPQWRNLPRMAEWISRALKEFGIQAEVESVSLHAMQKRLAEDKYQAAIVQVRSGPEPDISHILSSEAIDRGYNDSGYVNPEMDDLLQMLRRSSPEQQQETAQQILQLLKDDMPAVWLQWPSHYIVRRPEVRGLQWAVGPTLWQPHRIYLCPDSGGS